MAFSRTVISPAEVSPAVIVPPVCTGGQPNAAAWSTANRALMMRFQVSSPITVRYLNWTVGAASGNVQLGIAQFSGTGHLNFTRIAHTGIIACPAAGDIRTDLGATVLTPGDYAAFIWADNTTVTIRWTSAASYTVTRGASHYSGQAGGVGTSGSIGGWNFNQFATVIIEGDV